MARHDPHSYSDLTQGRISHIDFCFQADFETNTLMVQADYHFEEPVDGSLFLDTDKIDLKQATADGIDLEWEIDEQEDLLGERLHLKNLENISILRLVLHTSPDSSGLQWLPAIKTAGKGHPFMYSQCALTYARSVFPCQDTPTVRFTYSAEVEVPKPLTAVMAAEQVGIKEENENRLFSYKMPQPIPSYLFAIGIGNLVFRELGPRTGVYAEPKLIDDAAWEFAENEAKIVEAENLLGPYLWGRYDLLILPPSFPVGGMENPRLTFLTPTAILGNRGLTALITHELAHAWTGNLVTNATWEDFWLNEGWTTYAETRITEVVEGKDVADLRIAYFEKRLLQQIERIGADSPLTRLKVPLEGQDPEANLTSIPYVKGCFFLRECEFIVGRERFDSFIKKYIRNFQFQSLTTEAFLEVLKDELPEIFESLDVQHWVYEPDLTEQRYKPNSRLYNDVQDVLTAYKNGTRPTRGQVTDWLNIQTLAFLQALPKQIPVEDCQFIEDVLDLRGKNAAVLYAFFYAVCITSGYRDILPQVEEFTGRIGVLSYNLEIFRALVASDWAKPHARRMLENMRAHHHKVTIHVIDKLLEEAGL
jgi:aminopeptidase N